MKSSKIGIGQDVFGLEIDPKIAEDMFGYATNRKLRYNRNISDGYEEQFVNENYDYSNNQNFEDSIQRIFGNPNIHGNPFRNSNYHGFRDENQYAEDIKNRNEYDFKFNDNFTFDFVPDFKFDYDFRIDPQIRIDVPELEDTTKKRQRSSVKRKTRDKRDRNPFLDLLG